MSTYEVETKYRVTDFEALRAAFSALGANPTGEVAQADHYLAHPSRDFAETGEALRLRLDGDVLRITYKGSKLGGPAKTREEVELEVAGGAASLPALARLFEALGFRPVTVVRKSRSGYDLEYRGRHFHLALDQVDELGRFAEVETLASDREDLPDAQARVVEVAGLLGLTTPEPRSYLRMLLESRGVSR